jgi:hypothetical protein
MVGTSTGFAGTPHPGPPPQGGRVRKKWGFTSRLVSEMPNDPRPPSCLSPQGGRVRKKWGFTARLVSEKRKLTGSSSLPPPQFEELSAATPHPGPPPQGGRVRKARGLTARLVSEMLNDPRPSSCLSHQGGRVGKRCGFATWLVAEAQTIPCRSTPLLFTGGRIRCLRKAPEAVPQSTTLSRPSSLPPPLRGRAGVGGDYSPLVHASDSTHARHSRPSPRLRRRIRAGRIVEQSKFTKHRRQNAIEIFADLPVPAAKYAIATGFEPSSAASIGRHVACLAVVDTVHLDNEVSFQTDKVHDVWPDWMLPAKSQIHGSAFTKLAPKNALLAGHLISQASREKVCHRGKGPSGTLGVN